MQRQQKQHSGLEHQHIYACPHASEVCVNGPATGCLALQLTKDGLPNGLGCRVAGKRA